MFKHLEGIHSGTPFYFSIRIKNACPPNYTVFSTFPVRITVRFFNTKLRFTSQLVIILV